MFLTCSQFAYVPVSFDCICCWLLFVLLAIEVRYMHTEKHTQTGRFMCETHARTHARTHAHTYTHTHIPPPPPPPLLLLVLPHHCTCIMQKGKKGQCQKVSNEQVHIQSSWKLWLYQRLLYYSALFFWKRFSPFYPFIIISLFGCMKTAVVIWVK